MDGIDAGELVVSVLTRIGTRQRHGCVPSGAESGTVDTRSRDRRQRQPVARHAGGSAVPLLARSRNTISSSERKQCQCLHFGVERMRLDGAKQCRVADDYVSGRRQRQRHVDVPCGSQQWRTTNRNVDHRRSHAHSQPAAGWGESANAGSRSGATSTSTGTGTGTTSTITAAPDNPGADVHLRDHPRQS